MQVLHIIIFPCHIPNISSRKKDNLKHTDKGQSHAKAKHATKVSDEGNEGHGLHEEKSKYYNREVYKMPHQS